MKKYKIAFIIPILILTANILNAQDDDRRLLLFNYENGGYETVDKIIKTDQEWREQLSPEEFKITRRKGTEPAFSGTYYKNKEDGIYKCVSCGTDLFSSKAKYDSKTGWPSFTEPISAKNIIAKPDNSLFMQRTEILCARCDAHLGHVFNDGPPPLNKRYCINSAALNFIKEKQE